MAETCYIGVTGGDTDYGPCRDSIQQIERGPADALWFGRGTKGYEVRQRHVNKFLASEHDWLLMLDADMVYAPDTLTRLLAHDRPYLSGYYLQRRYHPMLPVWFKPGSEWPLEPFLDDPEPGRLHELGASGWGCVLIHREVIEATRARVLRGQWDIIEDEMALWPYDLAIVMAALRAGDLDALRRELRPLRGQFDRQPIGSDIRYPFYARAAGHPLYGDPDVRPGHVVAYPVGGVDYSAQSPETLDKLAADMRAATATGRAAWAARMEALCE